LSTSSPRSTGQPSLERLRAVAERAAVAGGRRSLEGFGGRVRVATKLDGSPVTRFDRAAEAEIRGVIGRSFPEHVVLGEEGGRTGTDERYRWIVDPIDGTKSFVRGVPLYAVLVGVEVEGRPSVGVIHLPPLGETVSAAIGHGCRWNARRAHVSTTARLSEATLLVTSVRGIERRGIPFRRLSEATQTQRGWGDGYGYALVATGRADAMVDADVHVWDVAPLLPILQEAGGRFTDWRGRATIEGRDAVGSNGRIHDSLLRLLRPGTGRRTPRPRGK
jgi:histidinol-phosphatase